MSKLIYFKRYLYVIDRLRNKPCSFQDLQLHVMRKLENEAIDTGFEYSVRTFERDKKDIAALFGIEVQYDRRERTYLIDEELIEEQSINRIMDAFSIHHALQQEDKLSPSVFLEKRKSLGTGHIYGIIHAVQSQLILKFTHQKHWEDSATQREVKPIAVKESQQRWYLVAEDKKDSKVKTFGLDRISNLRITDMKFKPVSYNVDREFQNAFGVETCNPVEKIVLQFLNQQGNYIRTFPLHASQKILSGDKDTLTVEIFIHVTNDIILEILKHGPDVKVISPASLQNKIKERISQMADLYR